MVENEDVRAEELEGKGNERWVYENTETRAGFQVLVGKSPEVRRDHRQTSDRERPPQPHRDDVCRGRRTLT